MGRKYRKYKERQRESHKAVKRGIKLSTIILCKDKPEGRGGAAKICMMPTYNNISM